MFSSVFYKKSATLFQMKPISFEIQKELPNSLGRVGIIHTQNGDIETPAFVTVGTKGTVLG